jgi:protein TonB
MKKILFLFLVFSFQNILSQTNDTIVGQQGPIYDAKEVDKMPEFIGGMQKFYQYVMNKFETPAGNKSGKILTKFVIEIDGSITNIEVVRDDVDGASKALKLFKNCPKWNPGEKNGEKVRTRFLFPIMVN